MNKIKPRIPSLTTNEKKEQQHLKLKTFCQANQLSYDSVSEIAHSLEGLWSVAVPPTHLSEYDRFLEGCRALADACNESEKGLSRNANPSYYYRAIGLSGYRAIGLYNIKKSIFVVVKNHLST
jgi:hypothetical protein